MLRTTNNIATIVDIGDIVNIDITSASDDDILQYNSSTQKWENNPMSAVPIALNDVTDVDITSVNDEDILQYNSSTLKWENGPLSSAPIALNDLTDVNIPTPAKGTLMVHDGTEYKPLPGGIVGQFITASPLFPNGIGWVDINSFRAVAHMYFGTNFSTPLNINITASSTWTAVTGLTQGQLLNITFAASVLTVGLAGDYQVTGACSFRVPGGSSDLIEWGVSINGANPTVATSFGGEEISSFYVSQPFNNVVSLSASDTVRIMVRNLSSTRDVNIGSLHYAVVKIAN